MEISNRSHFSTDAYLLSQHKFKADQESVSSAEKSRASGEEKQKEADATKKVHAMDAPADSNTNNSVSFKEQTSLQQGFNLDKAQKKQASNGPQGYKVTAHNSQIGHHAERAVSEYNSVENSQYSQELVNRIELMV